MRPSRIEVDLSAIRHNVAAFAALVGEGTTICAVVKADGYGHGDVPVAEAALETGAGWIAVALVEEGVRLREAGIEAPILVLSEPALADAATVRMWNLTPTVYHHVFLERLAELGGGAVHLKVDTGMARVGTDPTTVVQLAAQAASLPGVEVEGLWTHFAVAEEDADFTRTQIARFDETVERLAERGLEPPLLHLANTPGTIAFPEAHRSMVRVGLGLYGLYPSPEMRDEIELMPAMRVASEVSHVRRHAAGIAPSYGRRRPLERPSTIATVPIGYADGVPRLLSSKGGGVLVGGVFRPLVGTVTMDQIVVDVGDDPVSVGDEVVLIGEQGDAEITADDWAVATGTINYEIVCGFGPRLPRSYG